MFTFLFTDIEQQPLVGAVSSGMALALARHDSLLRQAIEAHSGQVFKTVGDAFYAVFPTVRCAVGSRQAQHMLCCRLVRMAGTKMLSGYAWQCTVGRPKRSGVISADFEPPGAGFAGHGDRFYRTPHRLTLSRCRMGCICDLGRAA
jgi:class 3 adenylate cyclase